MENSNKQIKGGIILMYLQMAINIVINLFYTPIMTRVLGQSEYGLYNLAASVISYLSLLSLGFGASYIRFYSRYKVKKDEEGIKKLNSLYLIVFSVLGAIVLAAGAVLIPNVNIFFNGTYSAADLRLAKTLMIFLVVNLSISFPASMFLSYVTSQERFIFQKVLNIGKTILSPCLCIAVLFMGYGSIGMVVVTTIISLIIDAINVYYCINKLQMKFKFGKFDRVLFKEIFIFSSFIAINQIVDQLNWQTDKVILGKMINASAVAIYAIASTLHSMYLSFSSAISSVFAPRVNRIVSENKENMNKELTDLFVKVGRLQFFVLMLVFTGFIFFGQYFINIWVGDKYALAYYITIILFAAATVPLTQNVGIEIQRAKNKHQFRSLVYLIIALLNVVLSLILCKFYGIIGVTIGTLLSNVSGCIIIMNIYYHKKIGLNIKKYWKEIFKASLGLIVPIMFGFLILKFVTFNGFMFYLACTVLYTIIYVCSIYFLGFNKEEKAIFRSLFYVIKTIIEKTLILLKKNFNKSNFILFYSHSLTMDLHILKFYESIKNEKYKIKFIFWTGNDIDKNRYLNYDINSSQVILSKWKYVVCNPKMIVGADLGIKYFNCFNSKAVYVNHGSGTLSCGKTSIPYSYQKQRKYYDYYFETNKEVVEKFDGNKALVGKLVYSGNKFSNDYRDGIKKIDEYKTQFGINSEQKVIFVTGSWKEDSLFQYLKDTIFEKLKELSKNEKYKFIVTIHPNEYRQYDANIEPIGKKVDELENYGIIVRKPNESFIPFLAVSDLVLSDFSSMGDHAIMFGKKICYLTFDDNKIFDLACCKLLKDKVPMFHNIDEFENCIKMKYPKQSVEAIELVRKNMEVSEDYWDNLCKSITNKIMESKL